MSTSHDSPTQVEQNGREAPVGPGAEQVTQADGPWPVPREYRVETVPGAGEEAAEPGSTVVMTGGAPPAARRLRRLPVSGDLAAVLLVALALALGAGAWYLLTRSDGNTSASRAGAAPSGQASPVAKKPVRATKAGRPARVVAPALSGTTLETARARLERAGLRVRVRTASSSKPAGVVLRQVPAPRSSLPRQSVVALVVSSGPRPVSVPDVVGAEAAYAAQRLRAAGLRVILERVRSGESAGTVLAESPASGSRVPHGATIRLRVAKPGSTPPVLTLAVPNVVGLRVERARALLERLGVKVRVVQADSDRPKGEVVSVSPAAGTRVRKGARVELGVSPGPTLVTVPDVTGLDVDSARTELQQEGFDVAVVDEPTSDPSQDGIVTDEAPAAGGQAKQGATVTITVARYEG